MMNYKIDDKDINVKDFISFVNQIWKGEYDVLKTKNALTKTMNITAYDEEKFIGCIRILTDGYFFGTITGLLVLPEYQKKGIGSKLLELAKEHDIEV